MRIFIFSIKSAWVFEIDVVDVARPCRICIVQVPGPVLFFYFWIDGGGEILEKSFLVISTSGYGGKRHRCQGVPWNIESVCAWRN